MKRRLPRGLRREHAQQAVRLGISGKTVDQLMHLWISREKRRTHKRERREKRSAIREQIE